MFYKETGKGFGLHIYGRSGIFKRKRNNLNVDKGENYMEYGPNPNAVFPSERFKNICFIKNIIKRSNIIVGDYTFYDDLAGPKNFEKHVTHHYNMFGDVLRIGKFCSIHTGITFVMNGINHKLTSATVYPFNLMGHGWQAAVPTLEELGFKGDTVVENDVWIGEHVTIMPGVHIGNGAIIEDFSVVTEDIPAYHIAGGNPCKIITKRFDDQLIEHLEHIQWWNWAPEKIFANLEVLSSGNMDLILKIE